MKLTVLLAGLGVTGAVAALNASLPALNASLLYSPNNTILQNLHALALNSSYNVALMDLLLNGNFSCLGSALNSTAGNWTLLVPTDQAIMQIAGYPEALGALRLCPAPLPPVPVPGAFWRAFQALNPARSADLCATCNSTATGANATLPQMLPCAADFLQYHVLPPLAAGNGSALFFNGTGFPQLYNGTGPLFNVTVLPTGLNSSCLVHLSNGTGSMGGVSGVSSTSNSTSNNQWLVFNVTNSTSSNNSQSLPMNVSISHGGVYASANVTAGNFACSNGVLHIVDAVLVPPASLNATLDAPNALDALAPDGVDALEIFLANHTDLLGTIGNLSGITLFLPDFQQARPATNLTFLDAYNVTDYLFPSDVIFNNQSFPVIGNLSSGVFVQQNYSNYNNVSVPLLFGANYSLLVNGTNVTRSNVLLNNGVLHFIDLAALNASLT